MTAANPWGITEPASGEPFEGPAAPGADSDLSAVINACDDGRAWFPEHHDRRFRARAGNGGLWLIRKVPQGAYPPVLLRTFSRTHARPLKDCDGEVAVLWYETARPDWPAETAQKWARKAIEWRARS